MNRTTHLITGLVLAIVAGSTGAAEADGTGACTARTDAISHLETRYEEQPVAMGLANNGGVVEILTNAAGTTWSILVTMPDGRTCMVAAGQHWERVQPEPKGARL